MKKILLSVTLITCLQGTAIYAMESEGGPSQKKIAAEALADMGRYSDCFAYEGPATSQLIVYPFLSPHPQYQWNQFEICHNEGDVTFQRKARDITNGVSEPCYSLMKTDSINKLQVFASIASYVSGIKAKGTITYYMYPTEKIAFELSPSNQIYFNGALIRPQSSQSLFNYVWNENLPGEAKKVMLEAAIIRLCDVRKKKAK